jgi:hypothetical protein
MNPVAVEAVMWASATQFWAQTGRAARPAIIATFLLLALTAISFVALMVAITRSGYSLATAIFGPLPRPGNGIYFLSFAVPAILLQGLTAVALRQRASWLRILGSVGALAIAVVSVAFVVGVGVEVVQWLTTGFVRDVGDLAGEIVAVPLAAALAALNARGAWLGVLDLRGHERARMVHP